MENIYIVNQNIETYNSQNEFARSSSMRKRTKYDYFRELNVSKKEAELSSLIEEEEEKNAFVVGRYTEDFLYYSPSEMKKRWYIFDPANRPIATANFTNTKNKEWKALVISQARAAGFQVIDKKDILFLEFLDLTDEERLIFDKIKSPETFYQTAFYWTDKESGLRLKAMPDFARKTGNVGTLIDCKSHKGATEMDAHRAIRDWNYEQQAQMQIEGALQTGFFGEEITEIRYFWIFFSKKRPYDVHLIEYDLSKPERRNLDIYKQSVIWAAEYEKSGGKLPEKDKTNLYF